MKGRYKKINYRKDIVMQFLGGIEPHFAQNGRETGYFDIVGKSILPSFSMHSR
jgi:hypothetical protein